jgi:hypothetical protein
MDSDGDARKGDGDRDLRARSGKAGPVNGSGTRKRTVMEPSDHPEKEPWDESLAAIGPWPDRPGAQLRALPRPARDLTQGNQPKKTTP